MIATLEPMNAGVISLLAKANLCMLKGHSLRYYESLPLAPTSFRYQQWEHMLPILKWSSDFKQYSFFFFFNFHDIKYVCRLEAFHIKSFYAIYFHTPEEASTLMCQSEVRFFKRIFGSYNSTTFFQNRNRLLYRIQKFWWKYSAMEACFPLS